MARRGTINKVALAILIFSSLLLADVVSDRPIVDRAKIDTIDVVKADEVQRLVDKLTLRIQRLENRVADLESEVSDLRAKLEE